MDSSHYLTQCGHTLTVEHIFTLQQTNWAWQNLGVDSKLHVK